MKRILLASVLLLGACDHYSNDLAALDSQYKNKGATDVSALMVTASADTTNLNAIETAAGPGMYYETFNDVLAKDYYALARHENDQAMDYKAARYYTQKAGAAAKGKPVMPGDPNNFDIPADQKEALIAARASLVNALETQRSPQNDPQLAKAVVSYDCWLDQAEEGKKAETATCANNFSQSMGTLLAGMMPAAGGNSVAVPFLPNQTALAPNAKPQIDQIIAALQGTTPATAKIVIDGGADTLSRARVAALRSVLQFNNVNPAYIVERAAPAATPVSSQTDTILVSVEPVAATGPGL